MGEVDVLPDLIGFWRVLGRNVLLLFYRYMEMFYQTGLIGRNPSEMFYCLNPHKRGITHKRLHTVTPKVSGKDTGKKIKVTLSLADMGTLNLEKLRLNKI